MLRYQVMCFNWIIRGLIILDHEYDTRTDVYNMLFKYVLRCDIKD